MRILLLFIVSQVLTDKVIWDGNEKSNWVKRHLSYVTYSNIKFGEGSFDKNGKSLPQDINIFSQMTLRNIKILELDISNYLTGLYPGIHVYSDVHNENQMFAVNYYDDKDFLALRYSTCQLSYCENGLYFKPSSGSGSPTKVKNTKYDEIFYQKFVTSDMNLKLDKFKIYGNNYPLIVCPYKNWVGTYSYTEFIPYQTSGIFPSQYFERQIVLPGYPRGDDIDIFVCGYLNYADDTKLTISYTMEVENYYVDNEVGKVENLKDLLKCSGSNDQSSYYYFRYFSNVKGHHKMLHYNEDSMDENKIFYGNTLYLYNKNNDKFKFLKEGVKHLDRIKPIPPTCKRQLQPQLKFKLRLLSSDGKKIIESSNDIQTMYVNEDMLKKDNIYKCEIFVENSTYHPYVSNYYDEVMDVSLISRDDNGNKIFHDKIVFKDNFYGFNKYECEINIKSPNFKYEHPIEKLIFVTLPSNLTITKQNEVWRTKEDIFIQCPMKISDIGEIDRIKVETSKNVYLEYLNVKDDKQFNKESNIIGSNYGNLITNRRKNDTNIKHLTTECVYKSANEVTFSTIKNGTILERIFVKNVEIQTNDKALIIGLSIGILILILSIISGIIAIYIVKLMNKRKRRRNFSLSFSTSSSSSCSSYSSSSSSGSALSGSALSSSSLSGSQLSKSPLSKAPLSKAPLSKSKF